MSFRHENRKINEAARLIFAWRRHRRVWVLNRNLVSHVADSGAPLVGVRLRHQITEAGPARGADRRVPRGSGRLAVDSPPALISVSKFRHLWITNLLIGRKNCRRDSARSPPRLEVCSSSAPESEMTRRSTRCDDVDCTDFATRSALGPAQIGTNIVSGLNGAATAE